MAAFSVLAFFLSKQITHLSAIEQLKESGAKLTDCSDHPLCDWFNGIEVVDASDCHDLYGLEVIANLNSVREFKSNFRQMDDLSFLEGHAHVLHSLTLPAIPEDANRTLEKLEQLRTLSVGGGRVDFSIFANASLEELALGHSVRIDNMEMIAANLTNVIMSGELFVDDDYLALSVSRRLMFIDISYANVTNLEFLNGCDQLKEIQMSYAGVRDFSPLALLENLQYIIASQVKVEDLSPLSNLTKLEYLWVDLSTVKKDNYDPIAQLTNLRFLSVESPRKISFISRLNNLEELWIAKAMIHESADFANLTKLKKLVFIGTQIDDKVVNEIRKLLPETALQLKNRKTKMESSKE